MISKKVTIFKVTDLTTCVSVFSTNLSEPFLILRRTERDIIKMYVGLHVNARHYACWILTKLKFLLDTFLIKYLNTKHN